MLNFNYEESVKLGKENPRLFWDLVGKNSICWNKPYDSVYEIENGWKPKWYVGGELNMCYNALDKHINDGYGEEEVVKFYSDALKCEENFTYNMIYDEVTKIAGILVHQFHLTKNDRVLLFLPQIPQSLFAIMACNRLGISFCFVYNNYPAEQLAVIISNFLPILIITANIGYIRFDTCVYHKQLVDEALEMLEPEKNSINNCLVLNRSHYPAASMKLGRDIDWDNSMKISPSCNDVVFVPSDHPFSVMYTSGSTGLPKGLVDSNGGLAVMNQFYTQFGLGIFPESTVFTLALFASTIGQTMGIFGPLMNRAKTIIFEGDVNSLSPGQSFINLLEKFKINMLLISSALIMKIMKEYNGEFNITRSSLKYIFVGGDIVPEKVKNWIENTFQCPVHILWGQTELGWSAAMPCLGFQSDQSNSLNTFKIAPGCNIKVVDSTTGEQLPNGCEGTILLQHPVIPSIATTIINDENRFYENYFAKYKGYYNTSDIGLITDDNTLKISSRSDDVINVNGLHLYAGNVEEICYNDNNVAGVTVVGHNVNGDMHNQVPVTLVAINKKISNNDIKNEIVDNLYKKLTEKFGNTVSFNKPIIIDELPRSINGKVLRKLLYLMINGQIYKKPPLLENPGVLLSIYNSLKTAGFDNATLPSH